MLFLLIVLLITVLFCVARGIFGDGAIITSLILFIAVCYFLGPILSLLVVLFFVACYYYDKFRTYYPEDFND